MPCWRFIKESYDKKSSYSLDLVLRIKSLFFIIGCISIYCNVAFSQNLYQIAQPEFRNFQPEEYRGASQNWSAIQDNRGVMYFGNGLGVLQYDGTNWKLIYTTNSSVVRSLDIDKNGTIFVGASSEFGFLEIDNTGNTIYHSLTHLLPENEKDFIDVWKVLCVDDKVYFCTVNKIFCFQNHKITIIKTKLEPVFAFKIHNKIYLIHKELGIAVIHENEVIGLPFGNEFIDNTGIIILLPYLDNQLLVITRLKGLFIYNLNLLPDNPHEYSKTTIPESILKPLDSEIKNFLVDNKIFSATYLNSSDIGIATNKSGIVIIDLQGNILNYLNEDKGLLYNGAYYLYLDKNQNLWATSQNGISYIDINAPVRKIDKRNNIKGLNISYLQTNDKHYVGTMVGLYSLDFAQTKSQNSSVEFLPIDAEGRNYWTLFQKNNFLFAAGNFGINVVDKNTYYEVKRSLRTVFSMGESTKFPDILFVGVEDGLRAYKISTNRNKAILMDEFIFPELKFSTQTIEQDAEGNLWLQLKYKGIAHIKFNSKSVSDYEIQFADTINNLPNLNRPKPVNINGKIYILTTDGLYSHDKQKFENEGKLFFQKDCSLGDFFCRDSLFITDIHKIGENKYFGIFSGEVGIFQSDKSPEFYNYPFYMLQSKFNSYVSKSEYYITASNYFAVYNPQIVKNYEVPFNVLIRKIILPNDSIVFKGAYPSNIMIDSVYAAASLNQPESMIYNIDYKNNSITFEFSSAFYEYPEYMRYSYYLENFDETWSKWSIKNSKEFTNLPPGTYTFKVKAKNAYNFESNEVAFTFKIKRPFYKTVWAYLFYFVIGILAIYLIIKLNSRRLKAKNLQLERLVNERTLEIQRKNDEITQQNIEISLQKEELQANAEKLEEVNHELEKLSIVASETDNAILIMDKTGKLEWTNTGFTKLFGYTFDEYVKEKGDNLKNSVSNFAITEKINVCIQSKKSCIFEIPVIAKNHSKVWVQTTLTPITNSDGKLIKLIAIQSDITKLKLFEQAILSQKEEIGTQKYALEAQNEKILEQKNQIEQQNEYIKGSIRTALKIQQAILPSKLVMNKYFDTFILYIPKDIVSGDFYWLTEIDEFIFYAIGDCTGHGVPGAFMSILAQRLLSEIISEKHIFDPAQVLERLDIELQLILHQYDTESIEGLDICLCRIQKKQSFFNLVISGAKLPVLVYSIESGAINKIKTDRKSIGGIKTNSGLLNFTNKNIQLHSNDILYFSTDGFIDQNSPNRRRFGTNQLIQVLSSIVDFDMDIQCKKIESVLVNWQQGEIQRDDITVIGIKMR